MVVVVVVHGGGGGGGVLPLMREDLDSGGGGGGEGVGCRHNGCSEEQQEGWQELHGNACEMLEDGRDKLCVCVCCAWVMCVCRCEYHDGSKCAR